MPFITERIYRELPFAKETIMLEEYPVYDIACEYKDDYKFIEDMKTVITNIRNIRTNMNVHPSKKAKMIFVLKNDLDVNRLVLSKEFIMKLGFGNELEVKENKDGISDNAISIISDNYDLYMPFEDLVDIEAEKVRLQEEKKKLEAEVARGEKMLSNPGFVAKAPQAKIDEEKAKLEKYKQMLESVESRLKSL